LWLAPFSFYWSQYFIIVTFNLQQFVERLCTHFWAYLLLSLT
jgi:hypothetical protein